MKTHVLTFEDAEVRDLLTAVDVFLDELGFRDNDETARMRKLYSKLLTARKTT